MVEVVDERALEHLVQLAQVRLVGHAVARAPDQPEGHVAAVPLGRVRHQAGLVRRDRPLHLPPRADHREARAGQPLVLPLVVGEGTGVDLLRCQPSRRTHLTGLADRPLDEHVGARAADLGFEGAGHDVHEEHPAAGPVVNAAPGLDLAVRVAHHDVLAGAQAVLGDLDQHVVDAGAGPAPALALVGAQEVGQPGDLETVRRVGACRPPSRPVARPGARRAPRGRSRTGTRRGSRVHSAVSTMRACAGSLGPATAR